jgi:hypothetical protein
MIKIYNVVKKDPTSFASLIHIGMLTETNNLIFLANGLSDSKFLSLTFDEGKDMVTVKFTISTGIKEQLVLIMDPYQYQYFNQTRIYFYDSDNSIIGVSDRTHYVPVGTKYIYFNDTYNRIEAFSTDADFESVRIRLSGAYSIVQNGMLTSKITVTNQEGSLDPNFILFTLDPPLSQPAYLTLQARLKPGLLPVDDVPGPHGRPPGSDNPFGSNGDGSGSRSVGSVGGVSQNIVLASGTIRSKTRKIPVTLELTKSNSNLVSNPASNPVS